MYDIINQSVQFAIQYGRFVQRFINFEIHSIVLQDIKMKKINKFSEV